MENILTFLNTTSIIKLILFFVGSIALLITLTWSIYFLITKIASKFSLKKTKDGIEFTSVEDGKISSEYLTARDAFNMNFTVSSLKEEYRNKEKTLINNMVAQQVQYAVNYYDHICMETNDNYKDKLTETAFASEDQDEKKFYNYRLVLFELLCSESYEKIKDLICGDIRGDHFDTKGAEYIQSMAEKACAIFASRINRHRDKLNLDVAQIVIDDASKSITRATTQILEHAKRTTKESKEQIEEQKVKDKEELFNKIHTLFPMLDEQLILSTI